MTIGEMIIKGVKDDNKTAIKIVELIFDKTTVGMLSDETAQLIYDLRMETGN